MEREMASFEDIVSRIPSTWKCIRCGVEFPNGPYDPMPHAFEAVTDPKTGVQRKGGDICEPCHGKPFALKEHES